MTARKILVLRGGALGDFIVTLPAIAALRRAYPDATIELIGNAAAAALAVNRGLLTRAYSQHESRWAALYAANSLPPELQDWLGEFDLVINYWPNADGVLAAHFPVRPGQRFLSAAAMPNRAPAAAHYAGVLEPLGLRAADLWYRLEPADSQPSLLRQGYGGRTTLNASPIAIHPGSGSRKKNWPTERWIELITRLSGPIVLIVGEAEAETWSRERLAKSLLAGRLADESLRLAEQLSLEQLVDTFSECRLFVGHDSGISHLAAACSTPCLLLFGPTAPATWAPPAPHVRVIHHGADLHAITADEVLATVRS
jgi:ADP-heptose:LPS heptosyltransferase